jgi:MFS family permease
VELTALAVDKKVSSRETKPKSGAKMNEPLKGNRHISQPTMPPPSSLVRLVAASVVGTAIEFYDFFLFATAAALVFNKDFFPTSNPLTGIFLAFLTYAVGFLVRPIGGMVFGHIGDRHGRRLALVLTLSLGGTATFCMGLLPTFFQVGVLAPVLLTLLRLIQGFALGGEWGGAVLLVAEHCPAQHRGFWTSLPQTGGPLGNLLSTAILALFSMIMSNEAFLAWGWRVPFLLSAILVFVGLYVRIQVEESPLFVATRARDRVQKHEIPVMEVFRRYKRSMLMAMLVRIGENTSFYMFTTFLVVYATQILKAERALVLNAITIGSVFQVLGFVAAGALSDRIGRRPTTLLGAVGIAVWIFFFYELIGKAIPALFTMVLIVGLMCHALIAGGSAALFGEIFATRVRYSGASIGYQLGSVLGGAVAPLIAVRLLEIYKSVVPVAIYVAFAAMLTIVGVLMAPETRGRNLEEVDR